MPSAPLRPCAHPLCSALVTKGRCPQHARVQDKARGTAQERGYDYAWSEYSKNFRARFPICGMRIDGELHSETSVCVQQGKTTAAQCVDHLVPMSKGGSKWDPNNHEAKCFRCNVIKGDK